MPGWIKLHRELMRKPIWTCSTPEQKVILVTLLSMANFEEKEWEWKGKRYHCEPGEFITSLKSIAELSGNGVSIQNVRTALARFEKYEFLTSESTNRNRKITIANWGKYQGLESSTNNQPNRQLTSNQQATNKQLTTSKKDKKDKKVKKDKNILSGDEITSVLSSWNALGLSQVKILNPESERYEMLAERIGEHGLDKVIETINLIKKSDWLLGNKGDWKASFDWLVKSENFIKVMEETYTDKKTDSMFGDMTDQEIRKKYGIKI